MTAAEAKSTIVSLWGDDGVTVLSVIEASRPLNKGFGDYLDHDCIATGGNLYALLLSGIRRRRGEIWDAIPGDLGDDPGSPICAILTLMGIDFDK